MKSMTLRAAALTTAALILAGLAFNPDAAAQRKKGAAIGAGLGALLGQGIGKDTESTLIGAGIGAGVGYVIGNERDKKKAETIAQPKAEPAPAQAQAAPAAADAAPAAQPDTVPAEEVFTDDLLAVREDVGQVSGTVWRLASMNPAPEAGAYLSKVIQFRPDGNLWTFTTMSDGSVILSEETYRVVDDVLIINKPGYLINARFLMEDKQLIMNAQEFSAVFERLTPEE